MRTLTPLLLVLCAGCPAEQPKQAAGSATPVADTASPKESPMPFKVLLDDAKPAENSVEYHLLVDGTPKHDDVQKLIEFLYRYLSKRRDFAPANMAAYVYNNEVQYKTPPRSPIASVIKKSSDLGPQFENKVPLEFWQQVEQALPHSDKGWKLEKKVTRDDEKRTLELVFFYTEAGMDKYAETLSFNAAIAEFIDAVQALFEGVPELSAMTFLGRWKDEDVVKVSLDRPTYGALKLNEVNEAVGQLHGRAFLELATERSSDKVAEKGLTQRRQAVYKKMLAQLKGKATISPKLK